MTHPRTKVVLQSRQFSASSSPVTPRTKVVLQSRQFSSSSSPDTPRTKVALESRQCLHFAHSTRTISAEGCARIDPIALSPAFRALDTRDLRRGSHFRLTLFVPPSAFKERIYKVGKLFSLGHLPCKFSILILALGLHWDTCILLHLGTYTCITLAYLPLDAFYPYTGIRTDVYVFKCQCGSVSVQV